MSKNPTNRELAQKIDGMSVRLEKIEDKVEPIHNFMIIQQDRQTRKSDGSVDWIGIAKQGLVLLTVALGIVAVVVNYIIDRVHS